ncbi:TPA: hypothetical protein N0F65_003275 [Lagenidium giganteum]|uniref:Rab-GAP TBC domain-containing protein n=1 Tax=Lagenidium giganteum TaxID=4803 RepID=A0AAV2YJ18_9STRA|nr:TPA: hypothetical protein N0F65_003275 [Lagenidium giganteum]
MCVPKFKAGNMMLELGNKGDWERFEVALAGASIGDLGLYYYAQKTDPTPLGCIYLHSAHIDVLEEVVMVVTQERTWFLCAANAREASDWAEAICGTIERVSQGAVLLQGQHVSSKRRRLSSNASAITLKEIQKREPKTRVEEFLEIFVNSNAEDIRIQAMKGAFSWSCMRNIAWKLWLDCLPQTKPFREWTSVTRAKRMKYEQLRQKHTHFAMSGFETDQEFLSSCEVSEDSLLHNIYKDVRRTRGAMDYFRDAAVQRWLIRILYTYSRAHPEVSYNQGMGELLATIVYLLHIEQWPTNRTGPRTPSSASSSTASLDKMDDNSDAEDASYVYVESFINVQSDASYLDVDRFLRLMPFCGASGKYNEETAEDIIREVTSGEFIEHDSYLLLEQIMLRMAGAYCPEGHGKSSTDSASTSPLTDQMNRIHHHILSRCDPPTARHLSMLGIEPEMFLLRWVRVLMSREFEMVQVWQIWDAIFSLTPCDFSFINLLCVAAVREFRDEILAVEDSTSVLLCLRDISERVEADRLVDNARELYDALLLAAAVEATNNSES